MAMVRVSLVLVSTVLTVTLDLNLNHQLHLLLVALLHCGHRYD